MASDPLPTESIKNVEVLRVGTFKGIEGGSQTWTLDDLQEIADAGNRIRELGGKQILWLGHTSKDPKAPPPPKVGEITRWAVQNGALVNDWDRMPPVVARLARAGAYDGRSIEALRLFRRTNARIAGEQFAQAPTGVALLGAQLPACDTLADIEALYVTAAALEDGEAGYVETPFTPVQHAAIDGEPLPATPAEPPDPVAVFKSLHAQMTEAALALVAGKTGSPIVRARCRALLEEVQRIAGSARVALAQHPEGNMDISALNQALGLDADTDADETAIALAAVTDTDVIAQVVHLMGSMEFASADQFVAWLAGKLDKSPADFAGIGQAVASAMGLDSDTPPSEGGEEAPGGAPPPAAGAVKMAKANDDNPTPQNTPPTAGTPEPEVVKLSAQVTELLEWRVAQEGAAATARAQTLVEAALRDGRAVPAQRATLMQLAQHSPDAVDKLLKASPILIQYGTKGTAGDADASAFEPNDAEIAVLTRWGHNPASARLMIVNQKRADAGLDPVTE